MARWGQQPGQAASQSAMSHEQASLNSELAEAAQKHLKSAQNKIKTRVILGATKSCTNKGIYWLDKSIYCLECRTPSREKSVKDLRYSFFSKPRREKSLSTVAVLGNTVASPPQNSFNMRNRDPTTLHASSKEVAVFVI